MSKTPRFTLASIVLDSPDARELAQFYRRILGWTVGEDEPDWVRLIDPGGGPGLSFQTEHAYVRPTWPSHLSDQQMMLHLDITVEDLDAAEDLVVEAGAVLAEYQPQDDVRVYLDPAGLPFCLFQRG